jgi:hypothetical protein
LPIRVTLRKRAAPAAMEALKRDDEEPPTVTAAKIFWLEPSW